MSRRDSAENVRDNVSRILVENKLHASDRPTSFTELADVMKVSRQSLSALMTPGKSMTLRMVDKLADALKTTTAELVSERTGTRVKVTVVGSNESIEECYRAIEACYRRLGDLLPKKR